MPPFHLVWALLKGSENTDPRVVTRFQELADYGLFRERDDTMHNMLESGNPLLIRLHTTQSPTVQGAFAAFVLYRIYQEMFAQGIQRKLTHLAAKLQLLPAFAKQSRKFGLAMVAASQGVEGFRR